MQSAVTIDSQSQHRTVPLAPDVSPSVRCFSFFQGCEALVKGLRFSILRLAALAYGFLIPQTFFNLGFIIVLLFSFRTFFLPMALPDALVLSGPLKLPSKPDSVRRSRLIRR